MVDTELRLFDSAGNQVAISTDAAASNEFYSVGRDAYLSYYVTTAETYYVGVASNSNRYYDPNVAGNGGARIIPASGINIGKYDLAIDVQPFEKPEVSLVASSEIVNEAEGMVLTLSINTTGTIPPERLEVDLHGDVANLLAQFTTLQTRLNPDASVRYQINGNTVSNQAELTGGVDVWRPDL